ncbi:MAG: YbaN family protein [Sinobacteraceae bacterium]|nr:YbaN family protein [Nevskiaceae bacterium]
MMGWVWKTLGCVALAFAALGVVLPLLPATPFVLVAAGAFARGSPRFHAWLLSHPRWGPIIDAWREQGAIPASGKILAIVLMLASLLMGAFAGSPPSIQVMHGLVILCAGSWILTRPTAQLRERSPQQRRVACSGESSSAKR